MINTNRQIIALALLVAGCATTTSKISEGMRVAPESAVSNCVFKGDVHGILAGAIS